MTAGRLEKLKIVFQLGAEPGAEVRIGESTLRQVVKSGGIGDAHALRMIVSIMERAAIAPEFKRNDGTSISASAFVKRVEKEGKWATSIEAGGISFRFGNVTALKHSFVLVEVKVGGSVKLWDDWVYPFLSESTFVQAWVSDVEYDHWQNANDPLQYTAVGREYGHLPVITVTSPYPRQVIDTSKNPGRWTLKSGYVEAVGAMMWLDERFWQCVGEDRKTAVLSADWLDVQAVADDVVLVKAAGHCFCDESTSQIQERLRALLYGT